MKIMIFTGKFGMGHYSASKAIEEEIKANYKNVNIEIIDIVDYLLPHASKIIYSTFLLLVSKFSSLYNVLNKTAEKYNSTPFSKYICKKLDGLFNKSKPDLIISTLPISTKYLSAYKETTGCDIKLLTYITDLCTHEEWIAPYNDYYFVGSKDTKNELIKKGISKDKVFVTGIPVKQAFKNIQFTEKKKNKKEVLIMGGGFGLIAVSKELLESLNNNENVNTTVITGSNKKLYKKLNNKYKNINIIGYTNEVYKYMEKADILISKSGGITTFEAIHTNTPLYVINPFLLQEKVNAKHIEKEKIGKIIWEKNIDEVKELNKLLNSEKELSNMKEKINVYRKELKNDSLEIVIKNSIRGNI